jgi:hypothetical protein
LDQLKRVPDVIDVAVFGNALHLVVQNGAAAEPQIRAQLGQNGIAVGNITPIRPTLEDAFVALTTSQGTEEHRK